MNCCPNWGDHKWREEYYGTGCENCEIFFAHGQAPWDAESDTDEKDLEPLIDFAAPEQEL